MDSTEENTSPAIQQIDKSSVHKICSGQVVLDLATAVKELIENSLDAGAKNVDVKLKEYGKELIEVCDDGIGIEESNFEGLALKHHTSKLREFNDLVVVETYGFRGEALSSLSALSNLCITTYNENLPTASKLEFDHDGKLKSCNPTARERGTTVSVSDLFHTLPVRYKEFQRNFKRDFGKLCNVLYAYSLVNPNIRLNCVNIVGKKKTPILSTKGNMTTLDVITSLFGATQAKKIVPFKQSEITLEIAEEQNLAGNVVREAENLFKIHGYVSVVTHGSGRSSPDRQFFFVNSRPCDHQKLGRTVNEIFHSYNHSQYPFVFLEITTRRDMVDVNITPDKRQVMLQQEKVLCALIKSSFKAMFDDMATFYEENVNKNNESPSFISASQENTAENSASSSNSLSRFRCKYAKQSPGLSLDSKQKEKSQHTLNNFFTTTSSVKRQCEDKDDDDRPNKYCILSTKEESVVMSPCDSAMNSLFDNVKPVTQIDEDIPDSDSVYSESLEETKQNITVETSSHLGHRSRKKINIDIENLKCLFSQHANVSSSLHDQQQTASSFRAKITASDNVAAEDELRRHVGKEMFSEMKVLGQFNLGFIIAKSNRDLFIVDQHATDEKYNFETLQKKQVLKTQLLIQPVSLELTPFQKNILTDNMDTFKKNGFSFDVSDATSFKLISAPVHRNWEFGVSDVEELIFLLSDSPGGSCRPSRVRQMFASRACRTSIMVGTALSKQKMEKLLSHMGEIEHPWNCPHGRPTMRHLVNLHRLAVLS